MKSGFVDECLSIAPLVTMIQPVFENINGCGIDNFIWQLVPRRDDALAENADRATVLLLCAAILYL